MEKTTKSKTGKYIENEQKGCMSEVNTKKWEIKRKKKNKVNKPDVNICTTKVKHHRQYLAIRLNRW